MKTVPYSEDGAADEWRTEDEFKQRQRQVFSPTFSLNLRLHRGKYVFLTGGER